ncbi:MAG: phosphoribosylglycinamide formyltransferase [Spirosomataceae bacterium]
MKTYRLAVFASGSGSNAERMATYFQHHPSIEVVLFVSNVPNAGVIARGHRLGIPTVVVNRSFYKSVHMIEFLQNLGVNRIVLGGFLWLIPTALIQAFPNGILNIHPSLLPKFGGKGMWGPHVHEAVVMAKEKQTGITIHLVNEHYDEGEILFQAVCDVESTDTPTQVAVKVQELEQIHYPRVVEEWILQSLTSS